VPRPEPGYPRRTQFTGISEIRDGVFKSQIQVDGRNLKRTFHSLIEARRWREQTAAEHLANRPQVTCGQCGREFTLVYPRKRFCSVRCSEEAERERQRGRAPRERRTVEPNIRFDGKIYIVEVQAGHTMLISSHPTLEEAREQRAKDIRYRDYLRTKTCPVCGTVFRAQHMSRVYCSTECRLKGRAEGKLVRPNNASPSSRRKWREQQRAEREARRGQHVPIQDVITNKPWLKTGNSG